MYASTSSGVANMYSCSTASLGRRDGRELRDGGRDSRREQLEDMLHVQEVEVASVTRQSSGIPSLPRTFNSYRTNRGELDTQPAKSCGTAYLQTLPTGVI